MEEEGGEEGKGKWSGWCGRDMMIMMMMMMMMMMGLAWECKTMGVWVCVSVYMLGVGVKGGEVHGRMGRKVEVTRKGDCQC